MIDPTGRFPWWAAGSSGPGPTTEVTRPAPAWVGLFSSAPVVRMGAGGELLGALGGSSSVGATGAHRDGSATTSSTADPGRGAREQIIQNAQNAAQKAVQAGGTTTVPVSELREGIQFDGMTEGILARRGDVTVTATKGEGGSYAGSLTNKGEPARAGVAGLNVRVDEVVTGKFTLGPGQLSITDLKGIAVIYGVLANTIDGVDVTPNATDVDW